MALSRKYHIAIAKIVRDTPMSLTARRDITRNFVEYLLTDNPQLDTDIFYYICLGNREKPRRQGLNLEEI